MGKNFYQEDVQRIPEQFEGIQANTCKNPKCKNFGLESPLASKPTKESQDRQSSGLRDPFYALTGLGKDSPGLKCKECSEIIPIKSNEGVFQEKARLGAYLSSASICCTNKECENQFKSLSVHPELYFRFGTTNGSQRFQCKLCKKTFSSGSKRRQQKRSEINRQFYSLIVNKVPINRICEVLDISPATYYHKLDWLYEQARGFVREREMKLLQSFESPRMFLSTDRQVHVSNWVSRDDKRNTELQAIGTADNRSSYVFGLHFNFDPYVNPADVEAETLLLDDYSKRIPFRKHARLWLQRDYEAAQHKRENKLAPQGSLEGDIGAKYLNERHRENIESVEEIDGTVKPPADGVLIHSEYTMHGHFHLLNEMLVNVGKVRFYLDQESGIRNAFMSAFKDRVIDKTADAFYVSVAKELTVNQKEKLIADCYAVIKNTMGVNYRTLSKQEKDAVLVQMIISEMSKQKSIFDSKELWLQYPLATMSEPEKKVAALTDISHLSLEHQANLYRNSSLHGIDRFFMQARRRISLFERGIGSGANARRNWYGYSAYRPEQLIKLAELFRLFYNFIHNRTKDKKTPAMRLGLAKGPVSFEKIIYFDRQ